MKLFLIITSSLLVTALIISIVAYWWVMSQIPPVNPITTETSSSSKVIEQKTGETETLLVPDEGVPLKNLPLGDAQKSALKTVGVDVNTFIITPAMQVCASDKLGVERMNQIIAGDAPSVIETTRLIPCVGAE